MQDDKIKVLYDAVSKDYNLGTEEEFRAKLADPNKRKKFYDGVGQEYQLGTFEEFENKVGFKKKSGGELFQQATGAKRADQLEISSTPSPEKPKDKVAEAFKKSYEGKYGVQPEEKVSYKISPEFVESFNKEIESKVSATSEVFNKKTEMQLSILRKKYEAAIQAGGDPVEINKQFEEEQQMLIEQQTKLFNDKLELEYASLGSQYEKNSAQKALEKKKGPASSGIGNFLHSATKQMVNAAVNTLPAGLEASESEGIRTLDIAPREDGSLRFQFKGNNTFGGAIPYDVGPVLDIERRLDKGESLEQILKFQKDPKLAEAVKNTIAALPAKANKDVIKSTFVSMFNQQMGKTKKENLANIERNRAESQELLADVPLTWEEAKATGNYAGYVGGAIGQGLGSSLVSVPMGLYTGARALELSEAYESGLNAKAEMLSKKYGTEVTPEMLVSTNDDSDVMETASLVADINGALETVGSLLGAGKLASSIFTKKILDATIKKSVGKRVKDALVGTAMSTVGGATTEGLQSANVIVGDKTIQGAEWSDAYENVFVAAANKVLGRKISEGQSIDDAAASITEEEIDEIFESIRQGAIAEGALGGVAEAKNLAKSGRAIYIDNNTKQPLTRAETLERIAQKKTEGLTVVNDPEIESQLQSSQPSATKIDGVTDGVNDGVIDGVQILSTNDEIKSFTASQQGKGNRMGRVLQNAKTVLSQLVPELKVGIYENDEAGSKVLESLGADPSVKAYGFYDTKNKTIYINKSSFGPDTAFHEAIHPIISAYKQAAPDKFKSISEEAGKQLTQIEDGTFQKYADRNEGNMEEALVEYLGDYASGKFDVKPTVFEKVKRVVERILESIGIPMSEIDLSKVNDLKQMADSMAKAFKEGRVIKGQSSQASPAVQFSKPAFADNVTPEVSRLKSLPIEAEDGATLNLDGTNYSGGGLIVPILSKNYDTSSLSHSAISDFIEQNKSKLGSDIVKVGLYKFPNQNMVSVDLNIVVPREFREQALEFGKAAGQESLFDLDTFENIKTGASGANPMNFSDSDFAAIAKALSEGRVPEMPSYGKSIPTVVTKETKKEGKKPNIEVQYIDDFITDSMSVNAQPVNFAIELSEGGYTYSNKSGATTEIRFPYKNKDAAKKIKKIKSDIAKASKSEVPKLKSKLKAEVEKVLVDFKNLMKANLSELLNSATPEFIELTKQWYVGANKIAANLAKKNSTTVDKVAGVIAALSPQKQWDNNLSMAERLVDIMTNRSDVVFDEKLYKKAKAKAFGNEFSPVLDAAYKSSKGKSINTAESFAEKAVILRAIDLTSNSPLVKVYSPDGTEVGLGESNVAWGTLDEISKAIMVMKDFDINIISQAPKVRSFYNNIVDPFNKNPYVTVDTHASSAAMMIPMNADNVSGVGIFDSGPNVRNTIVREAYEEVAKENGLLPRELQSITWELQRTGVNNSERNEDTINEFFKELEGFKDLSYEQRAKEIIRRNRSEQSEWAGERGITPQKDDYGWIERSGPSSNQGERQAVSGQRGLEQLRGQDSGVVSPSTGEQSAAVDDDVVPFSRADRPKKMNQTAKRIASDEETVHKGIQKEILSNPQRYMYTPQDLKDKKLELASMSDEDIVKETESIDKLINNISYDNNFAILSAIEAINRASANNQDARPIFDKLRALGTSVGQLLRQFQELKTATSAGIFNLVKKHLESQNKQLTDEQSGELQKLADDFIKSKKAVDEAHDKFVQSPSEKTEQALQDALNNKDNSFKELNKFVGLVTPLGLDSMVGTILQGNLLTTKSIVANVIGNALFMPIRQVELMAGDIGAYIYHRMHGKNPMNPLEMWFGSAFNGVLGFAKSAVPTLKNAIKGNTEGSKQTLEIRRGLHPMTALWQVFTSKGRKTLPVNAKGNIPLTLYMEKVLEGTSGIPAEIMFRLLYLGDAPFKDAARKASAYRMFAEAGGKSSADFRAFLLNLTADQKAEMDKRALEATFSDERTLSKVANKGIKFMKDTIDIVSDKIPNKGFREMMHILFSVIQKANVPFVTVPANLTQFMIEMTMPIIPLMGGMRYVKSDPRKASQLFARAGLGFSFLILADALIEGGAVVAAGEGDDDEKKQLKYAIGAPNTINIDAMRRIMAGIDNPDQPFREGDRYVDFSKLGPLGIALVARAQFREKIKDGGEDYNELAFGTKSMEQLNAVRKGMLELSFLQGTKNLVDAAKDNGLQTYFSELGNTMTAIGLPNQVSAVTRARRDFMLRAKDKDVLQGFMEKQSVKIFPALEDNITGVYPVINIWGDPVKQNKEQGAFGDINPYIKQFFDITNGGRIDDPLTVEIYNLSERVGEVPVSAPSTGIRVWANDDEEVSLTLSEQDYTYACMVAGKLKRAWIADSVNSPEWKAMTDSERVEEIRLANETTNAEAKDYMLWKIQEGIEAGTIIVDAKAKTYTYLQPSPFSYNYADLMIKEEGN